MNYVYENPTVELFVIELCLRKSNRESVCHPSEACRAPQLSPLKSQLPIAGRATIGHPPFNPHVQSTDVIPLWIFFVAICHPRYPPRTSSDPTSEYASTEITDEEPLE